VHSPLSPLLHSLSRYLREENVVRPQSSVKHIITHQAHCYIGNNWWPHGSHTFSKTIFHTFSILNEKNFATITYLHFCKTVFMEYNKKSSAKLSSAVKNKIWIDKWLYWEFMHLFHILCTFWPNLILFQGLKNLFHNSILALPRENSVT